MAKNLPDNGAREAQGVTIKEAARFFGVSREAVRLWIKGGKLPAVFRPSGRVWYIPASALHKEDVREVDVFGNVGKGVA